MQTLVLLLSCGTVNAAGLWKITYYTLCCGTVINFNIGQVNLLSTRVAGI